MDIGDLRREYSYNGVDRDDLADDPLAQFSAWFETARDAGVVDPNAMILATVAEGGQPTQRTVLLKYFDQQGFVFFTNLESKKAGQIDANKNVALLFPWLALGRQAIIEGRAEKISSADAVRYFLSRPHDSQLAAWVSDQSRPIASRQLLLQKFDEVKRKFSAGKVPMPSFWGGYRVVPERFEFWQGRESRLHDRFEYLPAAGNSWDIERLAP